MTSKKSHCETITRHDLLGRPVLKKKLKYKTHDKAVETCRRVNLKKGQIMKLVTYKCKVCHHYHIGRNGSLITPKYRNKLLRLEQQKYATKPMGFKIVGKIDLD